jgi:transcriptional regulatory protein RtcR
MAEEESGVGSKNRNYQKLLAEIRYAARESRHPILIEGPTGSGKTFIAREIVFKEKRDSLNITGGFYEINAATLEGGLVQSALFGHEKGQASNVTRDRKGCLELAHKGVLFLDEIGELPLQTQAILLKAIDEKSFLSATGKQIKSDFQLIAGTNKDLSEAVHAGTFRKDLFARINTFRFTLPGLAERSDDIASIFEEELKKLTLANGEPVLVRITPEARKRYLDFAVSAEAVWADNYRDLIGSLERMRVHAQNSILTLHIVNEEIERLRIRWKGQTPKEHFTQHNELLDPAQCDPFDSVQLGFVIETCKRYKSIAEAGRYLFNHSRKQRKTSNDTDRLRKYLSSHGLSWERIKQMAD